MPRRCGTGIVRLLAAGPYGTLNSAAFSGTSAARGGWECPILNCFGAFGALFNGSVSNNAYFLP